MPPDDSRFPGIFICYRREESIGQAGRLYDHLANHYGEEQLFMDLESLRPGVRFKEVINEAVKSCDIMLVLIGQNWLRVRERAWWGYLMFWDSARRRLDNPNDFVRLEVAAAFKHGVYVVPVLIQGTQMPPAESLPADIAELHSLHYFTLSDQHWKRDVNRLTRVLDGVLGSRRAERERQAATAASVTEAASAAPPAADLPPAATPPEAVVVEPRPSEPAPAPPPSAPRPRSDTQPAAATVERDTRRGPPDKTSRLATGAVVAAYILGSVVTCAVTVLPRWGNDRAGGAGVQRPTPPGPAQQAASVKPEPPAPAPSPTPPSGMVYVPGGPFRMGEKEAREDGQPVPNATISHFFMDEHEVTNEQYAQFLEETETRRRPPATWPGGKYPSRQESRPVTGVTWDDASEYARWAGKRLPTEEEWEFAARAPDGRRYPWGMEWKRDRANAAGVAHGVVNVKSYKLGKSHLGLHDMAGNAWEWTSTRAEGLCQIPEGQPPVTCYVMRGGSYREDSQQVATTYRAAYPARGDQYNYGNIGFRCAKDVPGQQ